MISRILKSGRNLMITSIIICVAAEAQAAAVAQRRQQMMKQQQEQMQRQYQEQMMAQQQAEQMAAYQQAVAKQQYEQQMVQRAAQQAAAQKAAMEYAVQKAAMEKAVAQRAAEMQAGAQIQQAVAQKQASEAAQVQQNVAAMAAYKQEQEVKAYQEAQSQAALNMGIKQYADYMVKRNTVTQLQAALTRQAVLEQELREQAIYQKASVMKHRVEADMAVRKELIRRRLGAQAAADVMGALPEPEMSPVEPEVPETIVGIQALWEALDRSARPWQQILEHEIKLLTVSEYIDRFRRMGIRITRPPGDYVKMIDSLLEMTPNLLDSRFDNVLSYAAIMEYDFENGTNKDELARKTLGEANFLANKRRVERK